MTTYRNMTQLSPKLSVAQLNDIFTPLPFEKRIRMLSRVFRTQEVLYTSSFGTRSVMLLHLISRLRPEQKVHFINTTYHFPETLDYRDQIARDFGLEVVDILPHPAQNQITTTELSWKKDPDLCCAINKVLPLEPIKAKHKVWITGLMGYQTNFRAGLEVFEQQEDIIKFNPLIDIDEGEWHYYTSYYNLPHHPLEALGYGSVGCEHCTVKGEGRKGRWKGRGKTECGLHPVGAATAVQEGRRK
jgi:phosphoadenosine phosphosulfate reductase